MKYRLFSGVFGLDELKITETIYVYELEHGKYQRFNAPKKPVCIKNYCSIRL